MLLLPLPLSLPLPAASAAASDSIAPFGWPFGSPRTQSWQNIPYSAHSLSLPSFLKRLYLPSRSLSISLFAAPLPPPLRRPTASLRYLSRSRDRHDHYERSRHRRRRFARSIDRFGAMRARCSSMSAKRGSQASRPLSLCSKRRYLQSAFVRNHGLIDRFGFTRRTKACQNCVQHGAHSRPVMYARAHAQHVHVERRVVSARRIQPDSDCATNYC